MTSAESEARDKLAQCGRALNRLGMYDLSGHISLRIPDSELILITPGGGIDKSRLRPEDLTVIDADGRRVEGKYPPPLETAIHVVVHRARPQLQSIAHLHQHWATVFSVVNVPLEIVMIPARSLGGPLPTFDEPNLVTTIELAEQLNERLGQAAGILMRWHGTTMVGFTLEEMFQRAIALEDNARLLWEARQLGPVLPLPPTSHPRGDVDRSESSRRTFGYWTNLEKLIDEQIHSGAAAQHQL